MSSLVAMISKVSHWRVTHMCFCMNKIRFDPHILFSVDEFVEKYDIEIVLTRLLLKSMIEFLSQSSNLALDSLPPTDSHS